MKVASRTTPAEQSDRKGHRGRAARDQRGQHPDIHVAAEVIGEVEGRLAQAGPAAYRDEVAGERQGQLDFWIGEHGVPGASGLDGPLDCRRFVAASARPRSLQGQSSAARCADRHATHRPSGPGMCRPWRATNRRGSPSARTAIRSLTTRSSGSAVIGESPPAGRRVVQAAPHRIRTVRRSRATSSAHEQGLLATYREVRWRQRTQNRLNGTVERSRRTPETSPLCPG